MKTQGYSDPMLKKLHDTIRSLRQAQRHALQAFRTYDEAQDELDRMACEGLLKASDRARVIMDSSGSFTVSTRTRFHA